MKKSYIITISKIAISLITLVALLYFADLPVLKSMLFSLHIKTICICTLLIFMMQAANTLKLYIVMSRTDVNFQYLLKTNLIATFFANAVPSSLGKDIIRVIYLGKSGTLRENAAAAVSLDRVSGLFTQLIILISAALWGLQYNMEMNSIIISAIMIIILLAALSYITFIFRARVKLLFSKMHIEKMFDFSELFRIIKQFLSSPSRLIQLSIASAFYQVLVIYNIVLLTHALGGNIKFYQATIVSFAAALAALIPASIAGWEL